MRVLKSFLVFDFEFGGKGRREFIVGSSEKVRII